VDVGVHDAGEEVQTGGVEFVLGRAGEVRLDRDDAPVADGDIGNGLAVRGDDDPAADQQVVGGHGMASFMVRPARRRGRGRSGGRS
jgi:hypothetical protein